MLTQWYAHAQYKNQSNTSYAYDVTPSIFGGKFEKFCTDLDSAKMDRDALINDYIRLKDRPAAPVERWQMVTTVRRSVSAKNLTSSTQPLKQITNITDKDFPQTPKTPQSGRLVVKAKSSKRKQRRRSRSLENSTTTTPGLHKTPRTLQKTPRRNGETPSSCRFIPNG